MPQENLACCDRFSILERLKQPRTLSNRGYGDRLWTKDAARLINAYKSRCFDEFYVRIYPNDWKFRIALQNEGC